MADIDINEIQKNVEELQDQNAIDFQQWKRLGQEIERLEGKIKTNDNRLKLVMEKIKDDYENLKKIIIDENVQFDIFNKIEENKKEINEKISIESFNNSISKINEQMETNVREIKNVSEDTRLFKPRVYAYLSQGDKGSVTWETYADEATYREHLTSFKKAGCDGFVLCLQIQPSKEQRDNFVSNTITEDDLVYRAYPSFDNVKLLKRLGDEIGVSLVGIKFHNNWIRDNVNSLTFDKWFTQYMSEAYKFANEFIDIKYFSILNESKTIINTIANKTKIKTLLNQLKKKGFITGFSGVNDFDYDYNDYINGIFIHTYPTISNKGEFTTYQDGIIGWESYGILETIRNMRKKHPNKTFLISETGCQNYWPALSLPEQNFNVDNELIEDGSPSTIYFYGMFENLKNGDYDFLDSVWLFYTNPIREKTQKLIYKYTNGGVK